ncbi:hypothetical protein QEV65_07580 [Trueperella pyogenes]|uniref:hypothetical protein n=1 Tax=Trueperella pyogenes TaxID=1661 RepID=UPI003243A7A9
MRNYDDFEKAVKNQFLTEKDLTAEELRYLRYVYAKPTNVKVTSSVFPILTAVLALYTLDTRPLSVWMIVLLGVLVLISIALAAYETLFLPFRQKVSDATSRIIYYRMTGEFDGGGRLFRGFCG